MKEKEYNYREEGLIGYVSDIVTVIVPKGTLSSRSVFTTDKETKGGIRAGKLWKWGKKPEGLKL